MTDPNTPVTGYPAPNGYAAYPPPPPRTTYPYAAHPPQQNSYYYPNNPYNQQNYPDTNSTRRANCLRRIFAFVIGLVIIFGTISFIVWLVLRPQLPEFRVNSLSFSNFTLSNSSLISFTSVVNLTARNPNKKMTLAYDEIDAVIYYTSYSLSETTVAPFSQSTGSENSMLANFAVASSFVERPVLDGINGDMGSNGNVEFNLRMISRLRFEAKAWKRTMRFLKVYCGPLEVSLPSNGRSSGMLMGEPRQCRTGF